VTRTMGTSLFVPSALAAILSTATAAERPLPPPLPVLTGQGFTGVVFPAAQARRERIAQPEAGDYWTPSAADVAEMESRLRSALVRQRQADDRRQGRSKGGWRDLHVFRSHHIGEILEHLAAYRRQYVGIVVQGEKRLFVNCFRGDPEEHASWRQQLVDVDDGGSSYWRIQYRVDRKRFLAVDINSDA
jgi:hypothetical protein